MRLFWAAVAAVLCLSCRPSPARADALTLDDAYARIIARHPDLARYRYLKDSAEAAEQESAQHPPWVAGLQAENLGAGIRSGTDQSEVTLSLSSVLERGGKRVARRSVATAARAMLSVDEESRRLDLLAEAARRFLDLLAMQSLARISEAAVAQRERIVKIAAERARAGATPRSVVLAADAEVARARLVRERSKAELPALVRRLAALWNERDPTFVQVSGDPLFLPATPPLQTLQALIEQSPELRRFAGESRLREAKLRLAQGARSTDVQWQIGLRRLQETKDWGAVIGFSAPIGAARRAEPAIQMAQADLSALSLERDAQALSLYSVLVEAHARLTAARAESALLRDEVLPTLTAASEATERAYRAGAVSYLEWAQLQSESIEARREQVGAALEAHRALIEIQRLTGEPFLSAPAAESQP